MSKEKPEPHTNSTKWHGSDRGIDIVHPLVLLEEDIKKDTCCLNRELEVGLSCLTDTPREAECTGTRNIYIFI